VTQPRAEPMQLMGKARKVTIFVGRAPGDRGKHNYLKILERLRAEDCATLSIVLCQQDRLSELLVHDYMVVDGVEGMAQLLQEITNDVMQK